MSEIPADKRFSVLCDITRAQHFAWREAVVRTCAAIDARDVMLEMWRITGEQTGRSYAARLDADRPLPAQIAAAIAWSSQCMGEDAKAEAGSSDAEAFVRHRECPWKAWHERCGLLDEDQPGCDQWFASTLETVNRAAGGSLRFETLETLPSGGQSCLRRIWNAES